MPSRPPSIYQLQNRADARQSGTLFRYYQQIRWKRSCCLSSMWETPTRSWVSIRRMTLIKDWRIRTERKTTEDEFNVIVTSLFAIGGIDAGSRHENRHFLCRSPHGHHPGLILQEIPGPRPPVGGCPVLHPHAHFDQQPLGIGGGPHRQCGGRLPQIREKPHHHRFRYGHHLRCGIRKGGIPGRSHQPGHHDRLRGPVP
jgi:hypothetical protein